MPPLYLNCIVCTVFVKNVPVGVFLRSLVSYLAGSGEGASWCPPQQQQPPGSGCWLWAGREQGPAAPPGVHLHWRGWGLAGSCRELLQTSHRLLHWRAAGPLGGTTTIHIKVHILKTYIHILKIGNHICLDSFFMCFSIMQHNVFNKICPLNPDSCVHCW